MNDATAKAGIERAQPLNRPRRITVDTDEEGGPSAVQLSNRLIAIESVVEKWRIDDEWWRDKPIARVYWRVVMEDGRVVDVYRDLTTGKWWRQAY
jgi:hypothetical protein